MSHQQGGVQVKSLITAARFCIDIWWLGFHLMWYDRDRYTVPLHAFDRGSPQIPFMEISDAGLWQLAAALVDTSGRGYAYSTD